MEADPAPRGASSDGSRVVPPEVGMQPARPTPINTIARLRLFMISKVETNAGHCKSTSDLQCPRPPSTPEDSGAVRVVLRNPAAAADHRRAGESERCEPRWLRHVRIRKRHGERVDSQSCDAAAALQAHPAEAGQSRVPSTDRFEKLERPSRRRADLNRELIGESSRMRDGQEEVD